ncbi:MAG: hypothetical protein ACRDVE_20245, partial [Actinocrinis sp.]
AALRAARTAPSEYAAAGRAAASRAPTVGQIGPAVTASPVASPAATPTSVFGSVPTVPINAKAAVAILKSLTPSGWFYGPYLPAKPGSLLQVDVNDGKGLSQVFVAIATDANSGMDPISCGKLNTGTVLSQKSGYVPPICNIVAYGNGDSAMQQVVASADGEKVYRIIVSRSDGIALEITAANGDGTNAKTAVTRTSPPLTVDKWTAIALSRTWQLRVPATLSK